MRAIPRYTCCALSAVAFVCACHGASVGNGAFRLSVEDRTGRLRAVTVGGRPVLVDDPSVSLPIAFELDGGRIPAECSWRCDSVHSIDEDSISVSWTSGYWRGETIWRVFPDECMLSSSLKFEWTGEESVRLLGIDVLGGMVKCNDGKGRYLLPGRFPPFSRTSDDFRECRVEEGSTYTPMVFGDDGFHSVMLCVDELASYADYSIPRVTERKDGFTLATRLETAGWMKKGKMQMVGDIWLCFREGSCDEHLRHTEGWFRKVGILPPTDSPDWIRKAVFYSMHPCGRDEEGRADRNGLALSHGYLPYLSALGVNCIWIRPVEMKSPYIPEDYLSLQPGVGSKSDLSSYVAEAHRLGIRVMRDAVPHGGRADYARAKEHPEFLAWKKDGKPDLWWTYDYFAPGWVLMFSNIVSRLTAESRLDGWRIDVATGSRFSNWNPSIPYARGSYARCQGALAQNRAIRAAARSVTADAATLGETTRFSGAAVCDLIYDFKPNLVWFFRFTDTETADSVRDIRRYLHEQQCAMPPGAMLMHYAENHDSLSSVLMFGQEGAKALFAMTAWTKGCPLVYQEAEDGCFESMRHILRIRRKVDELTLGSCDYDSVSAPAGVFACLRSCESGDSVVLVNFNGRRTHGTVSWHGGTFEADLGPFGYEVRRVRGSTLPDFTERAWSSGCERKDGGFSVEVRRRDGRIVESACRIAREATAFAERYRVTYLDGLNARDVQLVIRLAGTDRWFAHACDGDFESPFVVRHPSWDKSGSTVYHAQQEGAVRWRSSLHPFGFTKERSCLGGICGEIAHVVSGIDASRAEAVLLDRLGDETGLAVAIRSDDISALACEVGTALRAEVERRTDSFTGIPELTTVMAGWEWVSGDLKVRVQRNGCLRGVWRRSGGKWERIVRNAMVVTDTGLCGRDIFSGSGIRECKQDSEIDCPMSFWRDEDGTVHLEFGPGDLRPFGRGGKMSPPIWYRTRYAFTPGATEFDFESAVSGEREFEAGEGELALVTTYANGGREKHLWISPDSAFSSRKGVWHSVTRRFGFKAKNKKNE